MISSSSSSFVSSVSILFICRVLLIQCIHALAHTLKFEDQCLLIIIVDSDIPNNDKVNNLFPRMTAHTDSKLCLLFIGGISFGSSVAFAVPSRCNATDGCVETDRSIIGFTFMDRTSGESAHSEFKVHCLRPNSSSILSQSPAFASLSALLPDTWISES